ncbi:MAG: TetR family transcriptional regulator [Acidimicrobiia bacterium]|nr:TetR family transcriptional regulator [Acidimicrobiia bacterium]
MPTSRTDETAPNRKRGRGADPARTRQALTDAAFDTLRAEGFRGATARAIAARAGCNQAAIYYHFQGIQPLLIASLQASSARRLVHYRRLLGGVTDPATALARLDELHAEDVASGHLTVLAELVGGITAEPDLRPGLTEAVGPWLEFVADTIRNATDSFPWAASLPAGDVADMIFSLILGMELQTKLDGDADRFSRLMNMGRLVVAVLPAR